MNNKNNNHFDILHSPFYKIKYFHTKINACIVLFIYLYLTKLPAFQAIYS